jgi:flagellar biogenesis protein FliO
MANRKSKHKPQSKSNVDTALRAARIMRILFVILSLLIVLSMVLTAIAAF